MEQPDWGSSLNPSFSSFLIWKKSKTSTKSPPTKYLPNPSSWFHHHYQDPRPGPGKVETTGISWSFPPFIQARFPLTHSSCQQSELSEMLPVTPSSKLLKAFYYSWNNSQNCQQNWQHHQGLWSFYLTSSWSCQRFFFFFPPNADNSLSSASAALLFTLSATESYFTLPISQPSFLF